MNQPTCTGSPTFNLAISSNAFTEWPAHIPGLICKTPPVGRGSAPRFAQCCSGAVYNITSPTTPDDPAYPVSCATFCQVDPALNEFNDKYPYGWSEHFMCLTDGGDEYSDWEVVCATNSVGGVAAPTSYSSTPTGEWVTRSYTTDVWGSIVTTGYAEMGTSATSMVVESSETPASTSTHSSTSSTTSSAISSSTTPTETNSPSSTAVGTKPTPPDSAAGSHHPCKKSYLVGVLLLLRAQYTTI